MFVLEYKFFKEKTSKLECKNPMINVVLTYCFVSSSLIEPNRGYFQRIKLEPSSQLYHRFLLNQRRIKNESNSLTPKFLNQ